VSHINKYVRVTVYALVDEDGRLVRADRPRVETVWAKECPLNGDVWTYKTIDGSKGVASSSWISADGRDIHREPSPMDSWYQRALDAAEGGLGEWAGENL
jgi:hypothetical protein